MGIGVHGRERRRSTLELIHDILNCIYVLQSNSGWAPVAKTSVMQCSNLNTESFKRHIASLESNGLVFSDPATRRLRITAQGVLVHRLANRLMFFLSLANMKPIIAAIGLELHRRLVEKLSEDPPLQLPHLQYLEECEYIVAARGDRIACIRGENRIMLTLLCCDANGCTKRAILQTTDAFAKVDELIRLVTDCIYG